MTLVVRFFSIMVLSLGFLSGCAKEQNIAVAAPDSAQGQAAVEAPAVSPEKPTLAFRWPLDSATLIAPPVTIQASAIEACRARGYDTSHMLTIGIDGDEAVALFGCRGAD